MARALLPAPAGVEQEDRRRYMERSLASIFAAAATIALASLTVPHWAKVGDLTIAIAAFQGYPLAFVLWRGQGRVPALGPHAGVVWGPVVLCVGGVLAGGRGG